MIRNYIKVAIRNLLRQKGFSFINIFGLALGISCTALIGMWVNDELSYDKFHNGYGQIYRITATLPELKVHAAVSSAPLALAFKSEIPEVEEAVRITGYNRDLMQVGDAKFEEKAIIFADSNFFRVFTFPFIKGDPERALQNPEGIVITEEMAMKYFGTTDAVDKTIRKNSKDDFTVTGVIANIPDNSHLQFDFVQPMRYLARTNNDLKNNVWDNFNYYTYLKLNDKVQPSALADLEKKMVAIYKKNETVLKVGFVLQPLAKVHLYSNFLADIPGHGNAQNVYIFMIVAVFILVVACLNFMNLATARAARRAKEVGLRKVVGAVRPHLMGQFLAESLVVALLSLVLALLIIYIVLPYFNTLGGKNLAFDITNIQLVAGLLGITTITGLLAGSYPAFYLSGFVPATVLKGNFKAGGSGSLFRNTMVVIQFAVSISLIVGTTIVYRQLNYIQKLNLGFDKENLLYVRMTGELWSKYDALRASLGNNRYTSQYSFISDLPTTSSGATISVEWKGKDPNTQPLFFNTAIDENFEEVFKVTFLEGHGYGEDGKADSVNIIVNEAALKTMDMPLESAVGTRIKVWGRERTIIGVVKDFNFKPVQEAIGPMFLNRNTWGGFAIIRTLPGETENTIKALGQICKEMNPNYPFEYSFVDQDIANLYKAEQRLGNLFNIFAVLAIVISCLGLYGLSAYLAERRTRELGIRKVLGASGFQLVYLLSATFTRPILIATVIAVPVAWYGMSRWLDGFAYHITIDWMIFVIAFLSALVIAWLTVSFESIKAATTNPVNSLRSE
ncbi:ABC transporter permease [Fulvivirgaceae bacterium PWU4]|uniref:ABC transporter permease n=1 Tax=Chryseosolibacter histidini TaxID=2782349 RepID=A0AAP2DI08_9BACT|nr:ABC transporter permease [Chryseosolibacter histidini]MBT1695959.1 ABC transporter permease [Chryseosolibacter histidini]